MHKFLIVAGLSAALAGCAYNAPVAVTPNLNVYSSYGDKLTGTYLLYVEADSLSKTVKPSGITCSAHNFPLDIRDPFKQSVIQTMSQLVENVQVVDRPVPVAELEGRGAVGMVVVRAEGMNARLTFVPGFWTASPESTVELAASLTVDRTSGRVLGTTASGDGSGQTGGSGGCGVGAEALGLATEAAMKELLGQLGERMSNSPRLRQASQ